MGIPLCVICCFSLAAFNICSVCLILYLGRFHLGFFLFGTLWVSWTCVIISFPILGKFSTIISSSIFSWSFFLSSSSGTLGFLDLDDYFLPHFRDVFNYYLLRYFLMAFLFVFWDSYDSNVRAFNIVPDVSEIVLISFNSFFFFPLCFIYFYHSIFKANHSILQ